MPTINPIFDGSTPVERASGQGDATWNGGFLGYYSAYDTTPNANLIANADLVGSNWTVAAMRFGADGTNTTKLTDSDSGSGRRIDYLRLGQNSDVDLVSTRVKFIEGGDGAKHDIQLGSQFTNSINIGADLNIVKTASGYLGNLEVWNGRGVVTVNGGAGAIRLGNLNDRVIVDGGNVKSVSFRGGEDRLILKNGAIVENVNASSGDFIGRLQGDSRVASMRIDSGNADIEMTGNSRIFSLKLDHGNNTVTTEGGFLETFYSFDSNNTVRLGTAGNTSGGAGQVQFSSGSGEAFSHTIVAHGYLGMLSTQDTGSDATDDQSTDVTINYFAGALLLGNGDDTVKTGDYFVETISTSGGNDSVGVGAGGANFIGTGKGTDTVTTGSGEVEAIRTGDGDDTVTTGSGFVQSVSTGDGNDTVKIGTGSVGQVNMWTGDDTIHVSEIASDMELDFRGQQGVDTVVFSGFTVGVEFSLDTTAYQDVSGKGNFRQSSMENLTGSNRGDKLTGNGGENALSGRGGADRLFGGDQNDVLRGGNGNDKLYGQNGKDTLIGGKGKDVLDGGRGRDNLRGNDGEDVFVFGKNSGLDRVLDFTDGEDILRLEDHTGGFGDLSFANLGGNLRVTHDNGTIVLVGEAGTVLTSADFDFV